MSRWNTLSVPLINGTQCTLVPACDYRTSSGEWLTFGKDSERKQVEQDRWEFDRFFRPGWDMRTVSGGAELREVRAFLSDALNLPHWNLPADNHGVERILRNAVGVRRLVPVIKREWSCLARVSRPAPAPLRWAAGGGVFWGWGCSWWWPRRWWPQMGGMERRWFGSAGLEQRTDTDRPVRSGHEGSQTCRGTRRDERRRCNRFVRHG